MGNGEMGVLFPQSGVAALRTLENGDFEATWFRGSVPKVPPETAVGAPAKAGDGVLLA